VAESEQGEENELFELAEVGGVGHRAPHLFDYVSEIDATRPKKVARMLDLR
jgi:hypothetical protein